MSRKPTMSVRKPGRSRKVPPTSTRAASAISVEGICPVRNAVDSARQVRVPSRLSTHVPTMDMRISRPIVGQPPMTLPTAMIAATSITGTMSSATKSQRRKRGRRRGPRA
jgi:hypothetical protein